MQISLGKSLFAFMRSDRNNDGKLSKQEIAQGALQAKAEGDTAVFNLFGTFVQGGKDKTGLLPDADNDGQMSIQEMADLAAAKGSREVINTADFKAKFGNKAGSGNTISVKKLQELAQPENTRQQVRLRDILDVFAMADLDGDERLSRQEVAQAALDLMNQGRMAEYMLFATFVVGGKKGTGMFPDKNKDKHLTLSELTRLAKAGGGDDVITPEDFKAQFPDLAGDGNPINVSKLRKIAGQSSGSSSASSDSGFNAFLQYFWMRLMAMFGGQNQYDNYY